MKRLIALIGIACLLLGVRLYDTGLFRFTPTATLTTFAQNPNAAYRIDIDNDSIELGELLKKYQARILFTEFDGKLIYAFSALVPYYKQVNGERVNLMIYLGEQSYNVGVPLLQGSY